MTYTQGMLVVALGCGRLPRILQIAATQPIVVFGTMHERVLSDLTAGGTAPALPVYFYETG